MKRCASCGSFHARRSPKCCNIHKPVFFIPSSPPLRVNVLDTHRHFARTFSSEKVHFLRIISRSPYPKCCNRVQTMISVHLSISCSDDCRPWPTNTPSDHTTTTRTICPVQVYECKSSSGCAGSEPFRSNVLLPRVVLVFLPLSP